MAVLHDCPRFPALHTRRQENLVGMQKEKPHGLDHVPWRLDNRKMLGLYFVRPICVRSDEGDATAEADFIQLDCSGPRNLFVFLCSFIGRSKQLNWPPTA